MRFYELNPAVLVLARNPFHYLNDSAARIEVALGDARLSLQRESPQGFDLLVIDAFSSDSIPVHLLTIEALDLYLRHLKPEGLIAFHTSNRYLDLPPVISRIAQLRALQARVVISDTADEFNSPSIWVLLSRQSRYFERAELASVVRLLPHNMSRPWSDDYSDPMDFLH
jgi:spermidine synthase